MHDTKYGRGNYKALSVGYGESEDMRELGWNIEFYKTIFTNYWWYGLFFVIYLGGLLYIARQKSYVMKQVFVAPFLILLFTVFNPLLMEPILEMTDWRDRYSRFFWMLPVEILSAYLLACLLEKQKRAQERAALGVFVVCLLFLCGGSATKIELDDNIYKLDGSVIEVAEMIEAASDKENPVVFYDEELYYWIRQYDASIIAAVNAGEMDKYLWITGESIDVDERKEDEGTALSMFVRGVEIEPETVNHAMESRNADFFVRNTDFYSEEYLQQLNIVYVDEVDGYELYRCVHN